MTSNVLYSKYNYDPNHINMFSDHRKFKENSCKSTAVPIYPCTNTIWSRRYKIRVNRDRSNYSFVSIFYDNICIIYESNFYISIDLIINLFEFSSLTITQYSNEVPFAVNFQEVKTPRAYFCVECRMHNLYKVDTTLVLLRHQKEVYQCLLAQTKASKWLLLGCPDLPQPYG